MLFTISHTLAFSHLSYIFTSFLSKTHCHSQHLTSKVYPKSTIYPSPYLAYLSQWGTLSLLPDWICLCPSHAALGPLLSQESQHLCSLASFYGQCKTSHYTFHRSQWWCPYSCPSVPPDPPHPYTNSTTMDLREGCISPVCPSQHGVLTNS